MEIINVNKENLEQEHICCAISNNKDCQVISKKKWLGEQLEAGLVFKKGNVRGKCFIEYLPAENAWVPIDAPNFMYIDCFWVAGKFVGQGNGSLLLKDCIDDCKAKGKSGLAVLSSKKKKAFLSDPDFLRRKGFRTADSCDPFFELLYLPFADEVAVPKFIHNELDPAYRTGYVLFYTFQCPFTAKYVPLIEQIATDKKIPFRAVHVTSKEEARKLPIPFTSYSLFLDGQFLTHEILSEKKFEKIVENNQ